MAAPLIRSIPGDGMAPVTIPLTARQVLAMAGQGTRNPAGCSATLRPLMPDTVQNVPCR